MNELFLKCQSNNEDEMIVSKGEHICFEVFEDGDSRQVCIDNKQAFTLIRCLESFMNQK